MAVILEIIGWLIVLGVMLVLIIVTGNLPDKSAVWLMLTWAVPTMVCGLIVMVFARMLGELQKIRALAERQNTLLLDFVPRGKRIEPIFGADE